MYFFLLFLLFYYFVRDFSGENLNFFLLFSAFFCFFCFFVLFKKKNLLFKVFYFFSQIPKHSEK